jgi:hypothetical protein
MWLDLFCSRALWWRGESLFGEPGAARVLLAIAAKDP